MSAPKETSSSSGRAKEKPNSSGSAKVRDKALNVPKETAKKAASKTKEDVKEQAKPISDVDESPQGYAENRVEQSAEYTAEYAADKTKDALRPSRRSRRDSNRNEDRHEPDRERIRSEEQPPEQARNNPSENGFRERPDNPSRETAVRSDKPARTPEQSYQVQKFRRAESEKDANRRQQNSTREPEGNSVIREKEPAAVRDVPERKDIRHDSDSVRSPEREDPIHPRTDQASN